MSQATDQSRNSTSQRIEPDENTEPTDNPETLSRDDAFEMLSNRRRRFLLHYLHDVEAAAPLSDLAEQIAAWENDTSVREISASERKTVYTSLQQFHLPKMDETGVIEFDRRAGIVTLTDAAEELDIYLEVVDRYDVPWSFYYMGLSGIGIILATLSWAGMGSLATVPFAGWTVFLLAALTVSSVSHHLLARRMRIGSGDAPPEVDGA